MFLAIAVAMSACLAILLWKSAAAGKPAQSLAWAATLTWTLLLNVYVPIYDSVLLVVAVVLTLGALRDLEWETAMGWMTFLAVLIGVASWELESIAQSMGIQFLPILLAIFGLAELYILHCAIRQGLAQRACPPTLG